MSRWIEEQPDGTYKEEIADPDKCRHMYHDVCCNDKSDYLADWPTEEECRKCRLFKQEE